MNLKHVNSSPLLEDGKQPAYFSNVLVCLFTFKCDITAVVAIYLELEMFLEMSEAASEYSQTTPLRKSTKVVSYKCKGIVQ